MAPTVAPRPAHAPLRPDPSRRRALTVVLPVKRGEEGALRERLEATASDFRAHLVSVHSLHFARLSLVPQASPEAPSALFFETTFDGEPSEHLRELHRAAGRELDGILARCEGWDPAAGRASFERLVRAGAQRTSAFFSAHPGLGVEQIRSDARLHARVREVLFRERGSLERRSRLEVLFHVKRVLGVESGAVFASVPDVPARVTEPFGVLRLLGPLALALVEDAAVLVAELWGGAPLVRRDRPRRDPCALSFTEPPPRSLAVVAELKSGTFRRRLLVRTLRALQALFQHGAAPRALRGIHAVRWVVLGDGRLLFTSFHDGSLPARLFALERAARAALGLVGSSVRGFPLSFHQWLVGRGDDDRLLLFVRARQLPCAVAYSAYPGLTVRDVRNNAEIREILAAEPTPELARRLLELV